MLGCLTRRIVAPFNTPFHVRIFGRTTARRHWASNQSDDDDSSSHFISLHQLDHCEHDDCTGNTNSCCSGWFGLAQLNRLSFTPHFTSFHLNAPICLNPENTREEHNCTSSHSHPFCFALSIAWPCLTLSLYLPLNNTTPQTLLIERSPAQTSIRLYPSSLHWCTRCNFQLISNFLSACSEIVDQPTNYFNSNSNVSGRGQLTRRMQ